MCYRPEPDPFPTASHPIHRVTCAIRSDRGLERADNQDSAAVVDLAGVAWSPHASPAAAVDVGPGALLALVCDGMGGEAGGALASALGLDGIVRAMRPEADESLVPALLASAVESGSRRVRRAAEEEPRFARMGTTATVAVVGARSLFVAQVGDSRAYVLRGRELVQVTRDQTMLELLRSSGAELPEDGGAPASSRGRNELSNVILQALGSSPRLDVVVTRTPLAQGDVVMLCSDGLHGVVDDAEIARILASSAPEAACDALIAAALAEGGPDNVTCVVLRVEGAALPVSTHDAAPQVTTCESKLSVSSKATRSFGD